MSKRIEIDRIEFGGILFTTTEHEEISGNICARSDRRHFVNGIEITYWDIEKVVNDQKKVVIIYNKDNV